MAAPIPPFVAHCTELLAPLGPVRVGRMFGGFGFYVDEVFVAIVAGEQLYLKVDADSRPRFEAAGCAPFVYSPRTGGVAMSYWSAPAEALDSPALMLPWARLALRAALAARSLKPAAKSSKTRGARPPARRATAKKPA